jgi:hypothetical protein
MQRRIESSLRRREGTQHVTADPLTPPAAIVADNVGCLPAVLNPRTGDYWSAPFVAYRARTCRRLQEFARRSGTGVHDRHRLVVRRESRPRFAGFGCGVLSLPPACHAGGRGFESRRPTATQVGARRPRARRRVIADSANNTDLLPLDRTPSRSNPRHRPPGPKRRSWRLAPRTCIARASRRTGSGDGAQVSAATHPVAKLVPDTPPIIKSLNHRCLWTRTAY